MRRVLITGITGYIGSHLARVLLPDWEVFGLVRHPLRTEYIADIQDRLHLVTTDGSYTSVETAVREVRPDLVYHLAAYYTGAHGPEAAPALISSNVTFGAYLLEAMSACGCSALIYASTVMAHYGGAAYRPLNLYAATKQAFSDLLAYYADAGLVRAVTLVLSDTYGSDDRRPKILNLIKQAAQTGTRIALSSGEQDYDVVHIDDVSSAFCLAGEGLLKGKFCGEVFQVVPERPLTLRQTVEKLCRVNAWSLNVDWGERPSTEREVRKAIRLYPPVPGWTPTVSLDNGLRCL